MAGTAAGTHLVGSEEKHGGPHPPWAPVHICRAGLPCVLPGVERSLEFLRVFIFTPPQKGQKEIGYSHL